MVLTFVLQKRCWIDYDSNIEELERMMVAVSGGSNSKEGDGAEQKAPPNGNEAAGVP